MAVAKIGIKGQAWFCTTGLPSDVVILVDETSFNLHKFPLMSKSGKLHQLITEGERNPRARAEEGEEQQQQPEEEEGDEEEIEEELQRISLPDFPGGSGTFEAVAKFCYGAKIELTSSNAAPLRCAAEYLGMSDEYAEENLVSRTERFLAQTVLRSLRESVRALKSCEDLIPAAEDLGIVQRCIDSIAARACSSNPNSRACSSYPSSLLSWPIKDGTARGDPRDSIAALRNGIDPGIRRNNGIRSSALTTAADSWFEELTALSLPIYKRVISAMKAWDLSSEAIEGSLVSYAKRSIPGISRSSRNHAPIPLASETEQRELLETIITNLPLDMKKKSSGSLMTARFLFGLLRTVNILRASEDSRTAVERRIASQLEEATLDDLLMPSYSYLADTLYDVDCVERILGHYLEKLGDRSAIVAAEEDEEDEDEADEVVGSPPGGSSPLMRVGRLVDGYLSEIASDASLEPDKFCGLALALPDRARRFDDGIYRAVDLYLRAHPRLTEPERERVCGVMDCRKLTLEACAHAAQNERLPLRVVVQVLSYGHLELRRAVVGTLVAAGGAGEEEDEGTMRAAVRENQVLRLDMDTVRTRVHELERECSRLRKAIAKMDRCHGGAGERAAEGFGSLARRFRCSSTMRVCDSGQRVALKPKRSKAGHAP